MAVIGFRALACLAVVASGCGAGAQGRSSGLGAARVLGGAGGEHPDRWYLEQPGGAWLAPNGQWAVLASEAETVLVRAPSGERVARIIESPLLPQGALAFAPDSRRFAFVDWRRDCVAVWTVEPAREEWCAPSGPRAFVAFSPDGESMATMADDRIDRWSLASRARVWTTPVERVEPIARWNTYVAWPAPELILRGAQHLAAFDAETGRPRWERPEIRDARHHHYLGVVGGDAVIAVQRLDADNARVSGTRTENARVQLRAGGIDTRDYAADLVRIQLGSGAVRDRTLVAWSRAAAVFDDGTAVVVADGVAHHHLLGGGELRRHPMPEVVDVLTTLRDGRFAVCVGSRGLSLWDLRAGAQISVADAQLARIVALAVDRDRVISAAEDGSVVVRRTSGQIALRRQARAVACSSWAVAAPSRRVVCAAGSSLEWIDLDTDRRGELAWREASTVALDERGVTWVGAEGGATWIDPLAPRGARLEHPVRAPTSPTRPALVPTYAHIVSGGQAVVYGGAVHVPSGPWFGSGLFAMRRDGQVTLIHPTAIVRGLAANRRGDRLVVLGDGLQLWRRTGDATTWTLQWSVRGAARGEVAVSDDGALVALSEDSGRAIALYDGATGARIGQRAAPRPVSALAFGDGVLYAGTESGLVFAIDLVRRE